MIKPFHLPETFCELAVCDAALEVKATVFLAPNSEFGIRQAAIDLALWVYHE